LIGMVERATESMNRFLLRKRPPGADLVRHQMDEAHPDPRMNKPARGFMRKMSGSKEMG
jgi:hypothetical protein